jgi:predicted nucleotidyltransferase
LTSVIVKSRSFESVAERVAQHVRALREQHSEIQRVIWFGSWINGTATPGSDVDLCVILSHSDKSLRERGPDFLPIGFPVGLDVFPYTAVEFGRLAETSPGWYAAIAAGKEM